MIPVEAARSVRAPQTPTTAGVTMVRPQDGRRQGGFHFGRRVGALKGGLGSGSWDGKVDIGLNKSYIKP
jgi:hypothetical protein